VDPIGVTDAKQRLDEANGGDEIVVERLKPAA
jgi:hypothetical protein